MTCMKENNKRSSKAGTAGMKSMKRNMAGRGVGVERGAVWAVREA